MSKEEAIELLSQLSANGVTIFLYRYVFCLDVTRIAKLRNLSRTACYDHLAACEEEYKKIDQHEELVCAIQELFRDTRLDGFFDRKVVCYNKSSDMGENKSNLSTAAR